jgi:hypothetical protein
MMTKKHVAWTAIFLVVVFGLTVVIYPLLFNPNTTTAPDASPANMPVVPAGQ